MAIHRIEETTGSLDILIELYIRGPRYKRQLFQSTRHSPETVTKALNGLAGLGLIRITIEQDFPYRQLCELTRLGRTLAEAPLFKWPVVLWSGPDDPSTARETRNDPE